MRFLALSMLVLAACGVPSRAPDITGQVTRVSVSADRVVILVEERPGEQTGNKISVTVDGSARVYRQTDTGTTDAALPDLRGATSVSVWITGPVLESSPAQGKGEAVLIRSPR